MTDREIEAEKKKRLSDAIVLLKVFSHDTKPEPSSTEVGRLMDAAEEVAEALDDIEVHARNTAARLRRWTRHEEELRPPKVHVDDAAALLIGAKMI